MRTPDRSAVSCAWPEEPEAGDVGHGVRREGSKCVRGVAVRLGHRGDRGVERAVRRTSVAHRLEHEPGAERLRQQDGVAGPGTALPPDTVRVDGADDGEAVLRLVVADRVAARQDRPGLPRRLRRARQHLAEHLDGQLLGKRGHREREQRPAAHREHVVERVRRRDPAERARIVDDGREEVDGEHERRPLVEAVHGRVVGGIEPDQQVCSIRGDEAAEQLLEPRGRVLRRAPARLREARQRRLRHPASVGKESGSRTRTRGATRGSPPSPLSCCCGGRRTRAASVCERIAACRARS